MKIWTLSSLLGVGVLAVACGSDPVVREGEPETAISNLPLSAACSACAQTAMSSTCSAELSACTNNPSCFDVESCLAACAPNDVACFGECAKASAAFSELTSCVFCDTCPQECANDWSCGGQPPPPQPQGCDGAGDCATCSTCAIQAECKAEADQCMATSDCASLAQCTLGCNSDPGCLTDCVGQFPGGSAEFEQLASCVACNACPGDCAVEAQVVGCSGGSSGGSSSCDNSGSCASCASCAGQSACVQELGACWQVPECQQVVQCAQGCDDVACLDSCIQTVGSVGPELEALLSCAICGECSSDCDGQALGCPP